MNAQTLILTESMQPHQVVPWQDAVTMLFTGKVRVLATYDEVIGRVRFDQLEDFEHFLNDLPESAFDGDLIVLRTPSVMTLRTEISNIKRGVKFSRQNVLARDKFRCQYCGIKGTFETLNYDHVVPRSKGGKTTWLNIVASCRPCNSTKADRTPEQAGMTLLSRPHKPRSLPMTPAIRLPGTLHATWVPYVAA